MVKSQKMSHCLKQTALANGLFTQKKHGVGGDFNLDINEEVSMEPLQMDHFCTNIIFLNLAILHCYDILNDKHWDLFAIPMQTRLA